MTTTTKNQLSPIGQICTTLERMGGSIQERLQGTGIDPKRFIAVAKTAIQLHPDKDKLAAANRESLYNAIQRSAADGLMPDGREAALVVYGQQVQYQPMVQGLVKLARNSGEIDGINAEVVYSNDVFELYHDFDGVQFKHVPNWKEDRGEPILVWAAIRLKSGERIARAYPKKRIMEIASRSKMSGNYDFAKGKDAEEFWRKAAIRNILKYAPKSSYVEKAIEADNEEFVEQDVSPAPVQPAAAQPAAPRQTRAAAAVKAQAPQPQPEPDVIDVEHSEVLEEYGDEEIPA